MRCKARSPLPRCPSRRYAPRHDASPSVQWSPGVWDASHAWNAFRHASYAWDATSHASFPCSSRHDARGSVPLHGHGHGGMPPLPPPPLHGPTTSAPPKKYTPPPPSEDGSSTSAAPVSFAFPAYANSVTLGPDGFEVKESKPAMKTSLGTRTQVMHPDDNISLEERMAGILKHEYAH
ncbi:hypothetical protein L596_008881 [Steinernema carpocapsae]|uniref:Uncharacterized protein n=1 Tax=Steinernema carpocapsae TaxID=34508 RepID=A0A4U5PDY3_STECR|nr:hypothetical protein L596_008881 [Steinernema carpocapsae]